MSNNTSNSNPTFSHTTYKVSGIFKGITKNSEGTFFASIALPSGKVADKQAYVNVSCIVGKAPALQAFAKSICETVINEGKGTAAEVELTNLIASNSFDESGNVQLDKQNKPYINYTAFLNGIAFS